MPLLICHINFLGFYCALLTMFCFFVCFVILYCKCIVKGISSVVIMNSLAYKTLLRLHFRASQPKPPVIPTVTVVISSPWAPTDFV